MSTDVKSVLPAIVSSSIPFVHRWIQLLLVVPLLFIATGNLSADIIDIDPPGRLNVIAGGADDGGGKPAINYTLGFSLRALDVDSQGRIYFVENNGVEFFSSGPVRYTELDGTLSQTSFGSNVADISIQSDYLYVLEWSREISRVNLKNGNIELVSIVPEELVDVWGIVVDSQFNIFINDSSVVFRFARESQDWTRYAGVLDDDWGDIPSYADDGIPAVEAHLGGIYDLAIDPSDDALFIAHPGPGLTEETSEGRISRVDPVDGTISAFADGIPRSDTLWSFFYMDVLADGGLVCADQNSRVWHVSAKGQAPQVMAGNGVRTSAGDGKGLLEASMLPGLIAVDGMDNIYITSTIERAHERPVDLRIRYLDRRNDVVRTVIGAPGALACQSPTDSRLQETAGITVSADGIAYVVANSAILAVDPRLNILYSEAGIYGLHRSSADGVPAFGNPIAPEGVEPLAISPEGEVYFTEADRLRRIRKESGQLETVVDGQFRWLHFSNNGRLFAVKQDYVDATDVVAYGFPPEIVEVNSETGELSVIAAEDDLFNVFSFYGLGEPKDELSDFAADSNGNLYVLASGAVLSMNPALLQSEILLDANIASFSSLALDESEGYLYVGTEYGRVLRLELETGVAVWFAHAGEGSNGISSNPLDARFSLSSMTVSPEGDVYVIDRDPRDRTADAYVLRIEAPGSWTDGIANIGIEANIGDAVARKEDWLAVGVPNHPTSGGSSGQVLVYRDNDCRPILQERLEAPGGTSSKGFGNALAFAGDRLVVGSREASSQGDAFRLGTYQISGDELRFERDLSNQVSASGELSSNSLAAFGSKFAVGVPDARSGAGEVVVFNTGNLNTPSTLTSSGQGYSEFGRSLALHQGLLAVGTRDAGSNGAVELHEQSGLNFQLKTSYPSRDGKKEFGASLAMDDSSLYVGAPDAAGGRVYRYRINTDNNQPQRVSTIGEGGGAGRSSFGSSLRLALGVLFVGDPDSVVTVSQRMGKGGQGIQNTSANASGEVHLYRVEDRAGERLDDAPLFSVPASTQERFGASLDINNGRLLVGAPETDNGRGDFASVNEMVDPSLLSGLWFDPDKDGEGYNVLVANSGLVVFYYGYTADGQRLWLLSDVIPHGFRFGENINVKVFKATAGDFQSPVPSQSALVEYGLLSIAFGTNRSATFTLTGFDGAKVSRSVFLADTEANAAAYSGLWFDPQDDGEGYNVISGQSGTVIYYYGSSSAGERLWLITELLPAEIDDGTTLIGKVYEARGGDFLHPLASAESLRDWGEIEARFDNCGNGRFVLSGSDGNKTSNVIKLAGVSGAVCNE